jgi:ubiquitin-conjugating enzyme E2 J2
MLKFRGKKHHHKRGTKFDGFCMYSIEVFPDLCTAEATTQSDETLRRRKTEPTNQQQQQQQQQQPTTVAPDERNAIARTVSRWRRWVFVLVVFIYLILSKIASRSSSSSDSM